MQQMKLHIKSLRNINLLNNIVDNSNVEEEEFNEAVICVMLAVKEWGARDIWTQLKASYPSQYNELLYYALEMLPK